MNKALEGNEQLGHLGFLDIAEEYSFTKAANISKFYAGVCYMKQGQFEDAIEQLNGYSSSDLLLQARAYSLLGDANMELGNTDDAIKFYKKAKDNKPNQFFTPTYIMKLALAYEINEDFDNAAKAYSEIINKFPKAAEINDAKKYKALAEGLLRK